MIKRHVLSKPPVAAPTIRQEPSYQEIAQLAYRIWEERGHPEGSDLDDWLRAEIELRKRALHQAV